MGRKPTLNEGEAFDKFCLSLGRVCVHYANLELALQMICASLISEDSDVGLTAAAEMSFKRLIDLTMSLILLRTADNAVISRARALLAQAQTLEDQRNQYIHTRWLIPSPSNGKMTRWKSTAKRSKGLYAQREDIDPEMVDKLAGDMASLFQSLINLKIDLQEGGVAFRSVKGFHAPGTRKAVP